MSNVHPIRTLQHLAKDEISERSAIDQIERNLARYTTRQIAEMMIRFNAFETTRSK
jgi:hypothetical protein